MDEQEFAAWNERMAYKFDPDQFHRESGFIVRWIERCRVKTLLKFLGARPEHSVLEVGVGAGNILEQVRSDHRTGIDLSEHFLLRSRERLGPSVTLVRGDAEKLTDSLPLHAYDRVYCSEVLEHVQHPEKAMEEMAKVVKPDGIVVVTVPNEAIIDWIKTFLKAVGLFRILLPTVADKGNEWHLHTFHRAMLEEVIKPWFTIEKIVVIPLPFLPLRFVAKLRPKK